MTDLITHEGNEPPLLAPAALVTMPLPSGEESVPIRVDNIIWAWVTEYRPLTDDKGHKLISAEGLPEGVKWVVTDSCGCHARGFYSIPKLQNGRWQRSDLNERWEFIGSEFIHPGDWRDSLYRAEGR